MKTDQLIELLGTNLEPVKRGRTLQALTWALVVGGAGAFGAMLATLGVRPDITGGNQLAFLALKLVFTLSLVGLGTALLARLMQPGRKGRRLLFFLLLPFIAITVACLVAIATAPPMAMAKMSTGAGWGACLVCIPLFAIVPFAALIWALRMVEPTNLRRTGAVAGLVAGAVGATAYALHCADDSLPFIAIWYGLPIGFMALIGATLGARLLRW